MSTKLYLRDTNTSGAATSTDTMLDLSTTQGTHGAGDNKDTTTPAGTVTPPTNATQITAIAGGSRITWASPQLNAMTVSGAETFNLWAKTSNSESNTQLALSFDEGTGTTAADSSGNGNTATLTVTSGSPSWGTGQYSNCITTTGVGSISVPHAASIDNLGPATWTMWVKQHTTALGALLYKSDGNVSAGWWIDYRNNGGTLELGFQAVHSTTNLRRYTSTLPSLDTWFHLAITWDGSKTNTNCHVYVNKVEVSYNTSTTAVGNHTTDAAQNLRITDAGSGASHSFNGSLDNVRIYNSVLNSTQIANDYSTGIAALPHNTITAELYRLDSAGNIVSTIAAVTRNRADLTTTIAVQNWNPSITSRTLVAGDRLGVRCFLDDGASGTMASGNTVSLDIDRNSSGVDGDSWIQINEAISYYYLASQSETLTIAESTAVLMKTAQSISETLTIVESTATVYNAKATISESLTLANSTTVIYNAKAAPSESLTLTEATLVSWGQKATGQAESLTIAESTAATYNAKTTVSESLTIAESLVASQHWLATSQTETLTLAESTASLYRAIIGISETLTIIEATAAVMHTAQTVSESLTLTESTTTKYSAIVVPSESLTIAESVNVVASGNHVQQSESLTIVESTAVIYNAKISQPETLTLAESTISLYQAKATVSEALTVVESATVSQHMAPIAQSESLTIAESDIVHYGAIAASSESLALSESSAVTMRTARSLSESLAIMESVVAKYNAKVTQLQTLTIAETVDTNFNSGTVVVNLSESLAIVESVVAKKRTQANVSESFTIAESTVTIAGFHSAIVDSMVLSESAMASHGIKIQVSELFTIAESDMVGLHFVAAVAELFSLSELISVKSKELFLSESMMISEFVHTAVSKQKIRMSEHVKVEATVSALSKPSGVTVIVRSQ